jgi:putative dimethyl sulfoxide reductase chaperone
MGNESRQNSILKAYNMLLYFAGSMLIYEPSEECISDFWKNGILKKLPVTSSNPNYIKAATQLRDSCEDKIICGIMIREDYTRLFKRDDKALAPAIESLYRYKGDDSKVQPVESVTDFYNSYGWVSKFKGRIDDDHLGVELLFLTRLIDNYMGMDDEACCVEMRSEIRRFIDFHILSWVAEWNRKIQLNSNTLCYKGIGTLILACAEDIFSLFDPNSSSAFSIEMPKN